MRYLGLLTLPMMLTACLTVTWSKPLSGEAGCVTYNSSRPAVMDTDAPQTKRGILKLDMAMESACQ
jgi:hypothetical protein